LKAKKEEKTTAGLTISSDGIALAIVSHAEKLPALLHAEFYPCSTSEQATLLLKLNKQFQLDKHSCTLILSPNEYQLLQVESPDVPSQEQSAAIRWKIKDLIDFHIDDAVIDVIQVPGKNEITTETVQVVTCRNSVIQRYVDELHASQYALSAIDIAELASRNLLLQETSQTSNAFALLNLWDDYSRISLYLNNDLYLSRSSSIGLTTLAHIFENEHIEEASLIVLDSLALELQRTFDFYESHSRQAPIQQLFIQSNNTFPTTLPELIQQRTGITTQNMNLDSLFRHQSNTADSLPSRCLNAIGGALRYEY
jgi:MSHA biogenesis protein MshI